MSTTTQNLSFAGFNGALGIAVESIFGTAVAPTAYIPYVSHNFDVKNKLITNQAVKRSKGMPNPGIGTIDVGGTVETYADNSNFIGLLLAGAMGADTCTAGASGSYNHVYTLASPLHSFTFTVDDQNSSTGQTTAFAGSKINTLDISIKPSDFLNFKFGVISQTAIVTQNAKLSPTYQADNYFEFAHMGSNAGGTSTINGTSFNIEDFSISLKNNLKQNFGSLGGRQVYGINEQQAMVEGSLTILADSNSLPAINTLLYGNANGPTAGALNQSPMVFTFVQPASGGFSPSISFSIGSATFSEAAISRKRNDILSISVKFQANESTLGAQDDLKVTLVNSQATSYV